MALPDLNFFDYRAMAETGRLLFYVKALFDGLYQAILTVLGSGI
jgi:hypothetical protein